MSSLFKRLQSYRPRPEKSSREDFFTEAFCYTLEKNPKVLRKYIKFLIKDSLPDIDLTETPLIRPQPPFQGLKIGSKRPDVRIDYYGVDKKRYIIICEHKLDAEKDEQQLENYRNILNEYIRSGKVQDGILVFITLRYESRPDSVDRYFRWRELYPLMKWEAKKLVSEQNKGLYDEFLKYMEELGMKRPTKFTALEMAELCGLPKLIRALDECLENPAWREFRSIYKSEIRIPRDTGRQTKYNARWAYYKYIHKPDEFAVLYGIYLNAEKANQCGIKVKDPDYPELSIWLESKPNCESRDALLEYCDRFLIKHETSNSWKLVEDKASRSMIVVHKSMKDFIKDDENQIEKIQEWFAKHLGELKEFMDENKVPSEA